MLQKEATFLPFFFDRVQLRYVSECLHSEKKVKIILQK